MKRNCWYSVPNQSLAIYARNAGFDLAVYSEYSKGVQAELRRRSINEALHEIEDACVEQGFDLASVKDGVYVISLGNPLSINYRFKASRSEEHTSELQSLMRISYAVFCLTKKTKT